MTRAYNTAITQQSSGGPVPPITAGKNAIINGGFDFWQRGTSTSGATSGSTGFAADRWAIFRSAFAGGATISRQVTGDTTNLPFIQYCARIQRDSGNTGTALIKIAQNVETAVALTFAGRTITYSFYARRGANLSSNSSTAAAILYYGTGTDQNGWASGFTGSTAVIDSTFTVTTTWQRFSFTAFLPGTATEFAAEVGFAPTGTAGAADFIEVTGIQLEVGSTATPFSRAGGTIAGELAVCQRYFQRYGTGAASFYVFGGLTRFTDGAYFGSTAAHQNFVFPVPMRTTPTMSTTGTWKGFGNGNHDGVGTLSIQFGNNQGVFIRFEKSSGSWNSDSCFVQSNDGGYVNLSSEL